MSSYFFEVCLNIIQVIFIVWTKPLITRFNNTVTAMIFYPEKNANEEIPSDAGVPEKEGFTITVNNIIIDNTLLTKSIINKEVTKINFDQEENGKEEIESNVAVSEEEDLTLTIDNIMTKNKMLLTKSTKNTGLRKAYAVGDKIYCDEESLSSGDDYVEFQLFASKRTNINKDKYRNYFLSGESDKYCSTPTESSEDDSECTDEVGSSDEITIQKVQTGVIVNKEMFLTKLKWNTILEVDSSLFQCYVCDVVLEEINEHLNSKIHMLNLEKYKPIIMESSVIRLIHSNFHCAVCNVVIDVDDIEHFTSETHEENLMEAMESTEKYINKKVDNPNNNIRIKDSDVSDDSAKDSSENDYDESVDSIWGMPRVSYAGMAKRQKLATVPLPKFVEKYVGSRKVKVNYECWHMIIKPKRNTFYCMVCVDYYKLTEMAEHCNGCKHLKNLDKCKVLNKYSDHFIRKVDDKYCHCSHCNSIQLTHDIEDHIDRFHPVKTNELPKKANIVMKAVNNDAEAHIADSTHTVNNIIANTVKETVGDKIEINKDILNYLCKVEIFVICGHRVYLPLMNFHVVCFRGNDFYCGLCNIFCTEDIVNHINSLYHLGILQQTPFLSEFSFNVIRLIRGAMHCAICNLPITPQMIHLHIQDSYHRRLLLNALTGSHSAILNIEQRLDNKDCNESIINQNCEEMKKVNVENIYNDSDNENEDDANADEHDDNLSGEIDWESFVYIKVKDAFFKISFASYNSLMIMGNGTVYCFLCSTKVILRDIKKHIEEVKHVKRVKTAKFVEEYEGNLLRQKSVTYHCATCNVTVSINDIKTHIEWPTHVKTTDSSKNYNKSARQKNVKRGVMVVKADTVKELLFKNVRETGYEIIAKVKGDDSIHEDVHTKDNGKDENERNKIIIIGDDVYKISWLNWHSLVATKHGRRCVLCQVDVTQLHEHVVSKKHKEAIAKPLVKQNSNQLFRLVHPYIHCVICNVEFSNDQHTITKHVKGKKHIKAYETIKENSSQANSYSEYDEDVIKL